MEQQSTINVLITKFAGTRLPYMTKRVHVVYDWHFAIGSVQCCICRYKDLCEELKRPVEAAYPLACCRRCGTEA